MKADKFYHIYNRTNNKELLFKEVENYRYFLSQFQKYISPIANVYAYCLIPNHFHFVLQIKPDQDLKRFFAEKIVKANTKSSMEMAPLISRLMSLQFSHFFNSYTQAINKRYRRNGSLFSPNFKRKEIDTKNYLIQAIIYVHLNPENHGVVDRFYEYLHSSYNSILSKNSSLIEINEVIELFEDEENFKAVHNKRLVNEETILEIEEEDD